MAERIGRYTLRLTHRPGVVSYAAVGGKKEGEGPLGTGFDAIYTDARLGKKTWEQAESALQREALSLALSKAGPAAGQPDILLAGDLLNQSIASTFGLRQTGVPLLGLFSACAVMGEALGLAALLADSGAASLCGAVASSHFCTAERQFRYPLEYGAQRSPTNQWTATAAGAVLVGRDKAPVRITAFCPGRVTDLGVKDMNNMGAAMAPAAADTLSRFLEDTGTRPSEYDRIVTGDLGLVGSRLNRELMAEKGYPLEDNYTDGGLLLFDRQRQDVHAGGSGCGCSAAVLCSTLLPELERGRWRRLLFAPTGALMSPTSALQGEVIPAVCHAILLERDS